MQKNKEVFNVLCLLIFGFAICHASNTFKVLLIGSSHGRITIGQFPIMAYHTGVDVICANAYAGGFTIKETADMCSNGKVFRGTYLKFYDGIWHENVPDMTIKKMLDDEEWDVISIQRAAAEDRYWNEEQAKSLETILNYIKQNCSYSPKIVFMSGFADSYSIENREKQSKETEDIWMSAQNVKNNYGIDIIPMAPIVQALRNNDELAGLGTYNKHMLSMDSQHLDFGIGMYASGCICYDFFLRERFDKKVKDCLYIPTIEDMSPFFPEINDLTRHFTPIEAHAELIKSIVNKYYEDQEKLSNVSGIRYNSMNSEKYYSIDGRKISSSYNGVFIYNGRKYFGSVFEGK